MMDGLAWRGGAAERAWADGRWTGRDCVYRYPENGKGFVTLLLEDRDGSVWASTERTRTRWCALRGGKASCTGQRLGSGPSGAWPRSPPATCGWAPTVASGSGGRGAAKSAAAGRHARGRPGARRGGQIVGGESDQGLWQVAGDRLQPYRVHHAGKPGAWLADGEVRFNRMMRDRDGGLWLSLREDGAVAFYKDGRVEAMYRSREGLGLRSPTPESPDLADALRTLAREEALRIAGEALGNAMRHAGTERITVEIRFERRALRVTVRDDGRGIEPSVLREGGKLLVRSSPATGTGIEFRLPRSHAYSQPSSGLPWLLHKIALRKSAND